MDESLLSFDHASDQPTERTSSSEFLRVLQNFLGQNNIDSIGRVRIRFEPTENNNWTLVVIGETKRADWDRSAQLESTGSWPTIPTPPDDQSVHGTAGHGTIIACSSSDVSPQGVDVQAENDCSGSEVTVDRDLNDVLAGFDFSPPLFPGFPSLSTCSVPTWPSFAGDEAINLASPLFDHVDQMALDSPSPLSRALSLDPLENAFDVNYSSIPAPVPEYPTRAQQSTITPGREVSTQIKPSKRYNRPQKRRRDSNASHEATELIVKNLSQNVLCEDYHSLLKSELPRWASEGLWPKTPQQPLYASTAMSPSTSDLWVSPPPYQNLERAYLAVCQLDTRMSDDVVRNRIALIQLHLEYTQTHAKMRRLSSASSSSGSRAVSTVGRGDASHVIDRILENTHSEWEALDQRRRTQLRAKFHDKKKYGKRWCQLADALGPGILLVCATRLANAVRSTTVTANMLKDTIERIKVLAPQTMKVIDIVSPLAKCLLNNERFDQAEVRKVLHQLQDEIHHEDMIFEDNDCLEGP